MIKKIVGIIGMLIVAGILVNEAGLFKTVSPEEKARLERAEIERRAERRRWTAPTTCGDLAEHKTARRTALQDHVKESLKAPATAKFGSWHSASIIWVENDKDNNKCVFAIGNYVDAQNSFGALIRTDFIITVSFDMNTGKYHITDLYM